MNESLIKAILESAAKSFLAKQPNFYQFTSQTYQTEWNIAHHFANELNRMLPYFDCDLDICKGNFECKRPDIILHKRGSHQANFLVIEAKRKRDDVDGELKKIKQNWFQPPLSYLYGAVVVIDEREPLYIEVVKNSSAA
jgi:hypothetical protein